MSELFIIKDIGKGIIYDLDPKKIVPVNGNEKDQKEYIPLTGTEEGKTVTGDIVFSNNTRLKEYFGYSLAIGYENDNNYAYVSPSGFSVADLSGYSEAIYTNFTVGLDGFGVFSNSPGFRGYYGGSYYGANYDDNTYVQKKYVDLQHSYSTEETKTGGTWIDGKPIYRKVFTNVLGSGNISLAGLDIDHIVSNTGQYTDELNETFITLPLTGAYPGNSGTIQFVRLEATVNLPDEEIYIINNMDSRNVDGTVTHTGSYAGTLYVTLEYTKTTDPTP